MSEATQKEKATFEDILEAALERAYDAGASHNAKRGWEGLDALTRTTAEQLRSLKVDAPSRIETVRRCVAEERPLHVGVEWVRELAAEIDALIRPAPIAASEPVAFAICEGDERDVVVFVQLTKSSSEAKASAYQIVRPLVFGDVARPSAAGVTIPKTVRKAGFALSNCAFNLAQSDRLTDRERQYLDECRKAWDGAVTAADSPQTPEAAYVAVTEDKCIAVAKAVDNCIRNGFTDMRDIAPAVRAALTAAREVQP